MHVSSRITLETNYVKLNVRRDGGFFEYEVRFNPQLDARNARFSCLNKIKEKIGIGAKTFDGVTLCLPDRLEREV